MARNYNDWLSDALTHRRSMEQAIASNDQKNIVYHSGKYLYALKQAYKLNNTGIVPMVVTGLTTDVAIDAAIRTQLCNHQANINSAIRANKRSSNISNHTFSTELALKIRRLATRVTAANFATGMATKKDILKDSLGIVGTGIKGAVMLPAKIVSKVGPLAITILTLPLTVVASGLDFVIDIADGKVEKDTYNNTVVHQLTDGLKDAVRSLGNITYNSVGRI